MKFQIITLFPQLIEALRLDGVIGQAIKKGLIELVTLNPREFTEDLHRTVDDRPFGGGDGMLMMAEPLALSLESLQKNSNDESYVIYLSPKGTPLTDQKVQELAKKTNLTLICGRYGGVDQRFLSEFVQEEISIGDYVLSGGELAACVLVDTDSRFIPGVLGHEDSAHHDSITMGGFEAPAYTRPRNWRGHEAPEILLSGNHEKIRDWKTLVGGLLTFTSRRDLFKLPELSPKQRQKWVVSLKALSSEELQAYGVSEQGLNEFIKYLETQK